MTVTMQMATQRTIEGDRKNPYAPDDAKRRIHYSYTRRTGHCPMEKHKNKASSQFIGINDHGWIFRCVYGADDNITHLFVNKPPRHAVPKSQ